MNRFWKSILATTILASLCLAFIPGLYAQVGTITRRLIGTQDIFWATGGTGAVETYAYVDPSGNTLTLNKPDASDLKYRNSAYSAENSASSYHVCSTRVQIDAAITAIGATNGTIKLLPGTIAVTTDLTFPSNIHRIHEHGAILSVATGKTVTENGTVDAGAFQIYTLTGTAAVTGLKSALPEWFGAKRDGITNDAVALQNCMNSSTMTFLLDGTYKFSAPLYPPENHTIFSRGPNAVLYNSVYNTAGLKPYNYVTLINFTLRGTSNVYAAGADGIVILYYNGATWVDPGTINTRSHTDMTKWRGAHLTVKNLIIEDWSANGMGAGPWSNIENVTIQDNLNEGMLLAGNYTKVINPTINGVKGWGIDINASYVSVLGGHLYNCGDETSWPGDMGGIVINSATQTSGAVGNKIIGTTIDTSDGPGVLVYAPTGYDYPLTGTVLDSLVVKNVNVDASGDVAAINATDLSTSGTKLDRVNINNVIIDTTTVGHGIGVLGARNVNIDNYHIKSAAGKGIFLYSGTGAWQGINIGKGTIKSCGTDGIYAYGGTKLNIEGYNISNSLAVAAYKGIIIEDVTKFNIGQGIIDLDVTNGYGVYLTGTTGNGSVIGVNVSNSLAGIYNNATGGNITATGYDVSDNVITPLYGIGGEGSPAILQNRQAQNTGGGTATTGSWGIVPLNVEYEDYGNIVDVTALPAFSLGGGTYQIEAVCPFSASVQIALCRLYNVTDGAVQQNINSQNMYGTGATLLAASNLQSRIIGTFTIVGTKQLRIEYYCTVTVATAGHGVVSNMGPEIYAQVKITKIS